MWTYPAPEELTAYHEARVAQTLREISDRRAEPPGSTPCGGGSVASSCALARRGGRPDPAAGSVPVMGTGSRRPSSTGVIRWHS